MVNASREPAAQASFDYRPAAELLTRARLDRAARPAELPEAMRPRTWAQAYQVQDEIARRRGPVRGWKVGADSASDEPNRAPLTEDSIHRADAEGRFSFDASGCMVVGVEGELVYHFGHDLPLRDAPYGEEDIRAAVSAIHVGVELVDTRYSVWDRQDRFSRVADQGNHGALIVGPGRSDFQRLEPLKMLARMTIAGELRFERAGANTAGDPMRLLVWMANEGARSFGGLKAGDWVTTGSCTTNILVDRPVTVRAEFPEIGAVTVDIG